MSAPRHHGLGRRRSLFFHSRMILLTAPVGAFVAGVSADRLAPSTLLPTIAAVAYGQWRLWRLLDRLDDLDEILR